MSAIVFRAARAAAIAAVKRRNRQAAREWAAARRFFQEDRERGPGMLHLRYYFCPLVSVPLANGETLRQFHERTSLWGDLGPLPTGNDGLPR